MITHSVLALRFNAKMHAFGTVPNACIIYFGCRSAYSLATPGKPGQGFVGARSR